MPTIDELIDELGSASWFSSNFSQPASIRPCTLRLKVIQCSMECPRAPPWYAHVAFESYPQKNGGWSHICTLDWRLSSRVTDAWGANTFHVRKKNSRTFHLKFIDHAFRFFRRFPQINVGGDSAHFSPLEDASVSIASPSSQRVGCDNWRLHWDGLLES